MRKSVSAGWVEKLVESWLRFQNNYRHSVVLSIYVTKNFYLLFTTHSIFLSNKKQLIKTIQRYKHLKDFTVVFSNKKIFFIVTSFVWHSKKFSQLGLTKALLDTYLVHKYQLFYKNETFPEFLMSCGHSIVTPIAQGIHTRKMEIPGLQYTFE